MNAVEIEEAISQLAMQPFESAEFPFSFLEAFGNKATTIKRLRNAGKSSTNASDIADGVLQRNNIHIAVCAGDTVTATLGQLRISPSTSKAKAKFILATDGNTLEAEDMSSGETVVCDFQNFPNYFGFFLPLAGISTVKQIRNNPIDIQATGRLNRLYVELLKDNEDWTTEDGRHAMNQFMTRLIFCFFAEDTDIFHGDNLFTGTIEQMSDARSGNTGFVIGESFRAMDIALDERVAADLPRWAGAFPYVNGGLFTGGMAIPTFSRIARSYLLHVGKLNWKAINPDIFGSMIQAVADDAERGELGMHYTSVPNILKVLNPLFLDELRGQLEQAGDNARKLLNLRRRLAHIRVFDPACGSGNFLVIAYIQLREIEVEILRRRGDANDTGFVNQKSWIELKNFYGIEIKDFAVEVARLSLLIAEFQCDVRFLGQKEATALVLPLKKTGQILCGNALRVDWLDVCPVVDDADGEMVETYICGNPPYLGKGKLNAEQKLDMKIVFEKRISKYGYIDYVACWFLKAADYLQVVNSVAAFVSTNSVCQGRQAPILWRELEKNHVTTCFAHTTFKWKNNATHNAAVMCVILGITRFTKRERYIYTSNERKLVSSISAYLTEGWSIYIDTRSSPLNFQCGKMQLGNKANDGGFLSFSRSEKEQILHSAPQASKFVKKYYGSREFNNSLDRYCLWIKDEDLVEALSILEIKNRIENTREIRTRSPDLGNKKLAEKPHQFREMYSGLCQTIVIPIMTSVKREYLPCGLLGEGSIISGQAFGIYDGDVWQLALLLSKLHFAWIAAICGRLKEDYRYSNDLGWNTFPVPTLTEKNKTDLTRCAENILLAREAHFPKTIADLYKPEDMPDNLRHAHEQNDETLERIYIGRRFKNDTERLEKLFELYTKMTSD